MSGHAEFAVELSSCGHDWGTCCFACFCPPCAIATARSKLDDSSPCFNLLCVGAAPARWMIRTAYGIEGSACGDVVAGSFCMPCAANQLLHTVNENPKIPYTDTRDMSRSWDVAPGTCHCRACIYSIFCFQCAMATATSTATSMPWSFAFCCMNLCSARNMIRRHYRIQGDDLLEECLIPTSVNCVGSMLLFLGVGSCCAPITVTACTSFLAQMVEQAEHRPMPEFGTRGYLCNYRPPSPSIQSESSLVVRQPMNPGNRMEKNHQNIPKASEIRIPLNGYAPVSDSGGLSSDMDPKSSDTSMTQIIAAPSASSAPPSYSL